MRGRPCRRGSNRRAHPSWSVGVVGTACRKGKPGYPGRPAADEGRGLDVASGGGPGGRRTGSRYRRGRVTPAEGRTLTSGVLSTAGGARGLVGKLQTPERIRSLQRKLYLKAKAEPAFRFYLLYDKIHRADILSHAYALARSNGGAPGVDGITFERIEADGPEEWLAGLREDLVAKTYRAQ